MLAPLELEFVEEDKLIAKPLRYGGSIRSCCNTKRRRNRRQRRRRRPDTGLRLQAGPRLADVLGINISIARGSDVNKRGIQAEERLRDAGSRRRC